MHLVVAGGNKIVESRKLVGEPIVPLLLHVKYHFSF
jgi:hypothetical protein